MTNAMAQLQILLNVRARLLTLADMSSINDTIYDHAEELYEIIQMVEDAMGCNPETAAPSTQLGGGNHD